MNIIGKWKLKGMNLPTADGTVLYTKDNIPDELKDSFEETALTVFEFLEDGTYNMLQRVEGELLEQARAENMEISDDGYAVALTAKWEDRNGTVYYDTGAEGTVLDEAVDPFVAIDVTDDGCIVLNFGMLIYERA